MRSSSRGAHKLLYIIGLIVAVCAIIALVFTPSKRAAGDVEPVEPPVVVIVDPCPITHQQEVWLGALEWYESKGTLAVNPKDVDGTPSYYYFQFKPGTFKGYALRYGLLPLERLDSTAKLLVEMKNYDLQYGILKCMLNDPTVRWRNEFPKTIRDYIGLPPKTKSTP